MKSIPTHNIVNRTNGFVADWIREFQFLNIQTASIGGVVAIQFVTTIFKMVWMRKSL